MRFQKNVFWGRTGFKTRADHVIVCPIWLVFVWLCCNVTFEPLPRSCGVWQESGLAAWIGGHLQPLAEVPPAAAVMLITAFVACFTEFASNTATIIIFLPILAELVRLVSVAYYYLMSYEASNSYAYVIYLQQKHFVSFQNAILEPWKILLSRELWHRQFTFTYGKWVKWEQRWFFDTLHELQHETQYWDSK